MRQLGDLVMAMHHRSSSDAIRMLASDFAGQNFAKLLDESFRMGGAAGFSEDALPETDSYRIEELLTRMQASASSCKGMVANIMGMLAQDAGLAMQLAAEKLEVSSLEGPLAREVQARRNGASNACKLKSRAVTEVLSAGSAVQATRTDCYGGTRPGEYVQAARALAMIADNHPLNPPRYTAAEKLTIRDNSVADCALRFQVDSQTAQSTMLQSDELMLKAQDEALGEVQRLLTDKLALHQGNVREIERLRQGIDLEGQLAELVCRYHAEAAQLTYLMRPFAKGLRQIHGKALPKLCFEWETFLKESDLARPPMVERGLALLSKTEISMRELDGACLSWSWGAPVKLKREKKVLTASLAVPPDAVPDAARLRGVTIASLAELPGVALSAQLTMKGLQPVQVPFVMARSHMSRPVAYGSSQLWNRPVPAQCHIVAEQSGGASLPSVELFVVFHYIAPGFH